MTKSNELEITMEELEQQEAAELPSRELLATVSVLGLPLVGVSDVAVNVDTSGPSWLIG